MYDRTPRYRSRNSGSSALNKWNYSESISDYTVPKFHELRDRGTLICNPLASSKNYFGPWRGSVTVRKRMVRLTPPYDTVFQNYITNWKPGIWTPIMAHPGWVSTQMSNIGNDMTANSIFAVDQSDIDLAITEVSSRIGSGTAAIWVTFGESRKTIAMLCKALRFLRRSVFDVMRELKLTISNLRIQENRSRLWTKLSELWMEGRYGWRPFVYDAMSLWDANVQSHNARQRLTKHKIVGNFEYSTPRQWFAYASISPCAGYAQVDVQLQRFVKTGQTADFNAMITGPARVFGAYDMVGTVWDLIPFSWVVDKFINLGNFAQALQAALLVDERVGWVTKVTLAKASNPRSVYTQAGPINGSGWRHSVESDNLSTESACIEGCTSTERIELTSFSPILGFEGPLDWTEYLDLLALFRVLRKGT